MTISALIVDDSKTAGAFLKKLLSKLDIDTAVVESGEDALEYLKWDEPDVIFMDHMMPGLDGFETVKAIKADEGKSHIPIVMHTTRADEGHIYIGQAKALGAVDILNKPPTELELGEVLERLNQQEVDPMPEVEITDPEPSMDEPVAVVEPEPVSTPKVAPLSVDGAAAQPESVAGLTRIETIERSRASKSSLIILAISVLALIYFAFMENPRLQRQNDQLLKSLQWAVNQGLDYDYGELPLSGSRHQRLQSLTEHLASIDFEGTVMVEGHIGAFCLQNMTLKSGRNVMILPESDIMLIECDAIGLPFAKSMSVGQDEAFREFLLSSPLLNNGAISMEIVSKGDSEPLYDYPLRADRVTAGDWNVLALQNNRITVRIIPNK